MTVPTDENRADYVGNGTATSYPYDFKIFNDTDLEVYIVSGGAEKQLVLGTDYTVNGAGEEGGGEVVFTTAPADGDEITIVRVIPVVQETDIRNQGRYYPEVVEDAFDRSRMIDQQLAEQVGRSLKHPVFGGPWDAKGREIVNVGDPTTEGSATNRGWVEELLAGAVGNVPGSEPLSFSFTGDGVQTDYLLAEATLSNPDFYYVFLDGVAQQPETDFSILSTDDTGVTLRFSESPPFGALIVIRSFNIGGVDGNTISVTATGGTVARKLSDFANGVSSTFDAFEPHPVNGRDASLRYLIDASTWLYIGQNVRTNGRYEPGDGGGNDYQIVQQEVSGHDGGSRINVPNTNFHALGQFPDGLSIKHFGAVGDDTYDDTTPVRRCIVYSENRLPILFPDLGTGGYVINDMPELHTALINANSSGYVIADGETFHVSPGLNDTNNLYVDSSGSDTNNDGLSTSRPLATIQGAVSVIENHGPFVRGTWKVHVAAGDYPRVRFPERGLVSENPIEIIGADVGGFPNQPTVRIYEGDEISGSGFLVFDNTRVTASDIDIEGYNATASASGWRAAGEFSILHLINCWATGCFNGAFSNKSSLTYESGIIDGATSFGASGVRAGIISIFNNRHEIGTRGSDPTVTGPFIRNYDKGFSCREASVGHCNAYITDCGRGVESNSGSRTNVDTTTLERNNIALYAEQNGVIQGFFAAFGTGADANGNLSEEQSGGVIAGVLSDDWDETQTHRSGVVYREDGPFLNDSNDTYQSVYSLNMKAGAWQADSNPLVIPKALKIRVMVGIVGTNGEKDFLIRLTNSVGTEQSILTLEAAAAGAGVYEGEIVFKRDGTQVSSGTVSAGSNYSANVNNMTADMSVDTTMELLVRRRGAASGDAVGVRNIEVEYS